MMLSLYQVLVWIVKVLAIVQGRRVVKQEQRTMSAEQDLDELLANPLPETATAKQKKCHDLACVMATNKDISEMERYATMSQTLVKIESAYHWLNTRKGRFLPALLGSLQTLALVYVCYKFKPEWLFQGLTFLQEHGL